MQSLSFGAAARKSLPTLAGARDHDGIRFSSVKMLNRSSAEAMNAASTLTVVVLTALGSGFLTGAMGADAGTGLLAAEAPPGTGVPVRLVSVLTVKSLP